MVTTEQSGREHERMDITNTQQIARMKKVHERKRQKEIKKGEKLEKCDEQDFQTLSQPHARQLQVGVQRLH